MTDVKPPSWPARVVDIIDQYRLVINRGTRDGVTRGQRFLIYGAGTSDLIDPETGENLGRLEIVRGIGVVSHLQDKVATVSSSKTVPQTRRIVRRNPLFIVGTETETIEDSPETVPFDEPAKGDYVRPI